MAQGKQQRQRRKRPNEAALERRKKLRSIWLDIRWPVLAAAALISLALGVVGFLQFHQKPGDPYTLLDALYQSVQLFSMESVEESPLGSMPLAAQVARFTSPLVAAFAVLQALAIIFKDQVQLLALSLVKDHVIVCGLGRKGYLLVKEYREKGYPVVALETQHDNPFLEACRELGAIALVADGRDSLALRKARVQRARSLLVVCGDDGTNAEIALQARRIVEKEHRAELQCVIHIYDRDLLSLLRERELSFEQNGHFFLEFFNLFDSAARVLLDTYPPFPAHPEPGQPPAFLLVGMGHMGESLLIHAAQRWLPRFRAGFSSLQIRVVDLAAAERLAALTCRYPLVKEVCRFETFAIDTRSPEFLEGSYLYGQGGLCDFSHAYVCLDDNSLALTTGLALLRRLRLTPVNILVRMSEESGLSSLIQDGSEGGGANLRTFEILERTGEILEEGTHGTLARAIHETYLDEMARLGLGYHAANRPAVLPWDDLAENYRRENLRQAEHIGLLLRQVGCGASAWTDYAADQFEFAPEEVERMARLEHERWRADREAQGWRFAPQRDNQRRLHPALLPWEDQRLAETEREKTRGGVRKIPLYLARAGLQVYRRVSAVPPGGKP